MIQPLFVISLMLIASTPSFLSLATATSLHAKLHRHSLDLAGRDQSEADPPTSVNAANNGQSITSESNCPGANGTTITGIVSKWTVLCDTDFKGQDIYPFLFVKTFEDCLIQCEDYNTKDGNMRCAGFVFAPDRLSGKDDCYLKSSLNEAIYPARLGLVGAVFQKSWMSTTTVAPLAPSFSTSSKPATESTISTTSPLQTVATGPPAAPSENSGSGHGFQPSGRAPTVAASTYIGTSVDEVASEYVSHTPAKPQQIAGGLLTAGVNIELITDYPLASDTGTWTGSDTSGYQLAKMDVLPRLARDGGRGGKLNDIHLFIFCDTSTYGKDKDAVLGYLNGFVSSSVAIDNSLNGREGRPLNLTNPIGQWQDDVGRMRGWVPMTTGEEAFDSAVSGQGFRYAVWPNSSPILLNDTHAIMYAPLVYLQVDMQDQSSPSYTSLGNTLLLITIDPVYGPHADRLANQFFTENEVNWGSLGGLRAWGKEKLSEADGRVYLFGQHRLGIMLARVDADEFMDRGKYEFWNGESWTHDMPPPGSASNSLIVDQPVMNMDMIYSPAHQTFIMVYLTPEADNTFYYRYLCDKDNNTLSVKPPYLDDGDDNYVENILTGTWSNQEVLFRISKPDRGYAYAGGLHAGYFDDDDISNGGTKMLCTWTEHTKVDPDKPDSGYAHKSQVVELGFQDH